MNANNIFAQRDRIAGLAWGVHRPFREYIQRIPDGHMVAYEGAALLASGETFFPVDATAAASDKLCCVGTLEFRGHHGMMAVTVQQPWLETNGEHWKLSVVDPFEPGIRMPLVEIEFSDDAHGATRLTEAGSDLFMGNYGEHTLFDPVRIVWVAKDHNNDDIT